MPLYSLYLIQLVKFRVTQIPPLIKRAPSESTGFQSQFLLLDTAAYSYGFLTPAHQSRASEFIRKLPLTPSDPLAVRDRTLPIPPSKCCPTCWLPATRASTPFISPQIYLLTDTPSRYSQFSIPTGLKSPILRSPTRRKLKLPAPKHPGESCKSSHHEHVSRVVNYIEGV